MPSFESYMPHVGLLAWMKYGHSSPVLSVVGRAFLCLMTSTTSRCQEFFREAGLTGAGAEAAVLCIKREFVQAQDASSFVHVSPILAALTNCDDLFPSYATHSLIAEISPLLGRLSRGIGTREDKLTCFLNIMSYLR